MKLKYKLIISIILFLLVLSFSSKVKAASASLSVSSTSVTVGTKITVTTTIKGAAWDLELKGAVTASYADSTADAEDTTKKETTSFTPKKAGKYTVTLTGNVTGTNDRASTPISVTKTITVKEKNTNNNTTSDNTENNAENNANNEALLKDATLKNLGIRPNDFTGFRKATTSYSVSVPKNVDKVTIYATATNAKATVTGTGLKNLKIGKNTFNIKVTAEDKKTTKTYTLVITRKNEDENASDATLTNLGIRPKEYDFTGFKTGTTSYSASVPNNVEKITIYASAKSDKATITGLGSKTLKVGMNKCEIKITSEDKKVTKTYVINVTRKEKEEEPEEEPEEEKNEERNEDNEKSDLKDGLKSIEIEGYELIPSFSQDINSYKVKIPSSTGKLEINTETTGENIEVEIAGNEELKTGENIITILVHNTKDDSTLTYQITADVEKLDTDSTATNGETNKTESNSEIKIWIIRGIIIVVILLIIIFLLKKLRNNDEEYFDEEYETDEENEDESNNEYYIQTNRIESQTNEEKQNNTKEDLRNIGLFDDTQKTEYEEVDEPKKRGKYKGRRFK